MGLVWLRKPTLLHSARGGYNTTKMNAFEVSLVSNPFLNWYNADFLYGRGTVYFFCAGILLVSLYTFGSRLRHPSRRKPSSISFADRVIAAARYTTARQFRVKSYNYYSPPLGAILGVAGLFAFVFALMLGPHPYYWPSDNLGHSPPVATRTGWISIAIMPFMIAFSMKVNLIGFITDTSHEKLQVFHRWTAIIMYLTSLAHTFPFIVQSIYYGEMELVWKTSPWYWSGVAALIPQTWLIAMSWGPLRNRYYETFKKLHFIVSGIFMAALFIHCNFRLTSWDYFIATGVLFTISYFGRIGRTLLNSGAGLQAVIQQLPDDMVSISVDAPERLTWTAGQHVFIRFLSVGVHALSSHPFTVTTLNLTQTPDGETQRNNLELVVRAHGGITRRLHSLAAGKASLKARVLIDGPYGGISTSLKTFDRVYFFAGGSGATFAIPLLLELSRSYGAGIHCKHMELVLSVRHAGTSIGHVSSSILNMMELDALDWLKADLDAARTLVKDNGLTIRIHITREDSVSKDDDLKGDDDSDANDIEHSLHRPNLPLIVSEATRTTKGRVAFVACGPDSFMYDVRHAVAEAQLAIVDGFGKCNEIFLHTENYSW